MAYILCIDTSTAICSIALLHDDNVMVLEENDEGNTHASQITLLIDAVMKKAGIVLKQLDAVAVSKGPGSYTGLRVGVSSAKGLCYALDIPLIGINTLESLSRNFFLTINNFKLQTPTIHKSSGGHANFLLCPMLDARRMEVFCALFDEHLNEVKKTEAKIIDENSFADELKQNIIYFFGTGTSKCKNIITHPNAKFIDDINCSAKGMGEVSGQAFVQKRFEDIAYFEPFYLKDFAGTIHKKK